MQQGFIVLVCVISLAACGQDPEPEDAGTDARDGDQSQDTDISDSESDSDSDADEGEQEDSGDLGDGGEECDGGSGLGALSPQRADAVGPYPVGVTHIELVDPARAGRTLPVEIWYPAIHCGDEFAVRYDYEAGDISFARVDSPLGAIRDAPLDESSLPRPFVLFSHGNGGIRHQSIFLTEYLASHGFIVAAPDHTGNTMTDLMAGNVDESMAQSAIDRPLDISFLIDEIVERTDSVIPMLSGAIDEERIGVTGHSFGGYTSLVVSGASLSIAAAREYCAENLDDDSCMLLDSFDPDVDTISYADDRVRASVPLAPGGFLLIRASGVADVGVPTLIQAGDVDYTTPLEEEQEPVFAALPPPAWLAIIEGAGHFTFSDICILVDLFGREALESLGVGFLTDGCGEENIDIAVGHQLINTLATAFFQMQLQDHASGADYLTSGSNLEVRSR